MLKLLGRLSTAAVAACTIGCATGYHPSGFGGGYSETQLQPDVVDVRFSGNGYTSMERASDFLLLRCAEVALERGCSHFVILGQDGGVQTAAWTTPEHSTTIGTVNSYGNMATLNATTTTTGGQTHVFHKPYGLARIKLLTEPADGAMDARFLRDSLRSKYGLP